MLYNVKIGSQYFTITANSPEEAIGEARKQYVPDITCSLVTPCEDVNGEGKCPHHGIPCPECIKHYYKGKHFDWVEK